MKKNIIDVSDLNVFFERPSGSCRHILKNISLGIKRGRITCLVGETGSGKTIFMKCILGLIQGFPGIVSGNISYNDMNLLQNIESYWRIDNGNIVESKNNSNRQFNRMLSKRLMKIKGKQIVMIFQNASEHLHPLMSLGKQFKKVIQKNSPRIHKKELRQSIYKLFDRTKISYLLHGSSPDHIYSRPLSGGECQRAMIAMNLAAENTLKLILMDELTTDLDASTRDGIIQTIIKLKMAYQDLTILFSSHDLDVVKKMADDIVVMKDGKIRQYMSLNTEIPYGEQRLEVWNALFNHPDTILHPYTFQLKEALNRLEKGKLNQLNPLNPPNDLHLYCPFEHRLSCDTSDHISCLQSDDHMSKPLTYTDKAGLTHHLSNDIWCHKGMSASTSQTIHPVEIAEYSNIRAIIQPDSSKIPFLSIQNINKTYITGHQNERKVLCNINLNIYPNEDIAIIGDSGSGKSTLANIIVGLIPADSGTIQFSWENTRYSLHDLIKKKYRELFRRRVQLVFQDCYEALNKKMTVGEILERTTQLSGRKPSQIDDFLTQLNLVPGEIKYKYPSILSGGEIRRIFIARAFLALSPDHSIPKLMILDEVTRGLDMYVQEIILNFLLLRKKIDHITYMYISHDLKMIKMMSSVLVITFGGRIWEIVATKDLETASSMIHPYTRHLFNPDPDIILNPHIGQLCPFIPLCEMDEKCKDVPDFKLKLTPNMIHGVACHSHLTGKPE